MIRRLTILLLIVGCEDETGTNIGTNPIPCIPDLVCGNSTQAMGIMAISMVQRG